MHYDINFSSVNESEFLSNSLFYEPYIIMYWMASMMCEVHINMISEFRPLLLSLPHILNSALHSRGYIVTSKRSEGAISDTATVSLLVTHQHMDGLIISS